MRTAERLRGVKQWVYENLCEGRMMKTYPESGSIADIAYQEPQCFLAWQPTRPDLTGKGGENEPISVVPSITIMPNLSKGRFMEEKRFDRYNNVARHKDLGQTLSVSMLFSVYEPGTRLPGFVESAISGEYDMSKLTEGTEQGLFTLFNWMDDCIEGILGARFIPHTDLFLNEESLCYSLYTDQSFVVDKRPIYYGFVNCEFYGHADEKNSTIQKMLD